MRGGTGEEEEEQRKPPRAKKERDRSLCRGFWCNSIAGLSPPSIRLRLGSVQQRVGCHQIPNERNLATHRIAVDRFIHRVRGLGAVCACAEWCA